MTELTQEGTREDILFYSNLGAKAKIISDALREFKQTGICRAVYLEYAKDILSQYKAGSKEASNEGGRHNKRIERLDSILTNIIKRYEIPAKDMQEGIAFFRELRWQCEAYVSSSN